MSRSITLNKKYSLVLALFLFFAAGYLTGHTTANFSQTTQSVFNAPNKPVNVDFSLFWDAWKVVGDKYVKPVDDKERVYGAIAGMVASLGDPYSMYMKPSENARFNDDLNGNFEGIGAELVQKDGLITVVAPLEGSPAQKAGVMAGDIIVKINDKDAPASLEEAVNQIRGAKGTQVKLGLVRSDKPIDITITRDNVEIKSVSYKLKDSIAVIKINQFTGNTVDLLDKALDQAKKDNSKGIVLDLRNDPGGLLNVAVDVTSRFIDPGVVVIERDKTGKEIPLNTVEFKNRITLPTVVLINKGSASASEIFAGALQDDNRAKIIGETSFGKGSVQSIEPLKDGSSVRITIAEWLTPKKREINKQGIKPDIEVKLSDDDVKNNRDPQLDKALAVVRGQ